MTVKVWKGAQLQWEMQIKTAVQNHSTPPLLAPSPHKGQRTKMSKFDNTRCEDVEQQKLLHIVKGVEVV